VRFHTSHHDGGAHRISDSLGATAFRATPLYADYYARVGLDHALPCRSMSTIACS
jgi:hypothetical protein